MVPGTSRAVADAAAPTKNEQINRVGGKRVRTWAPSGVARAEERRPRWSGFLTRGSPRHGLSSRGAQRPAEGAEHAERGVRRRDRILAALYSLCSAPSALCDLCLLRRSLRYPSDVYCRDASRIQWRDRVGFAPTSRNRRGLRRIVT